jgi:putative transcription factor
VIEGAKMIVCGRCTHYGSDDWSPISANKPRRRNRRSVVRRKSEVEQAEELELVVDYGKMIKTARQKAKMSVEDLARKMQEKESVIKKLEKEEFNPNPSLAKKLRRVLGIEIMEKVETTSGPILSRPLGTRTLGDLIGFKEMDEEN